MKKRTRYNLKTTRAMHLISKIKIKAFMVTLSVGFSSELYAAEVVNPSSSLGILSFVERVGL